MKQLLVFTGCFFLATQMEGAETFKVIDGRGEVGNSPEAYEAVDIPSDYPLKWWAKTGPAPMKVEFSPRNLFRLLPRSEVQITGDGAASSKFRRVIELKAGEVEVELQNLQGSRVEVETPTAVCGAVGTVFAVNADQGKFTVREGRVFAQGKQDGGFEARSVGGTFTLAPGTQNAFTEVDVSGDFSINGVPVRGQASVTLAKARGGTGDAAVQIRGGSVGGSGAGKYLMRGGTFEPLTDSAQSQTHSDYLTASREEGSLNLQRESLRAQRQVVPANLNTRLDAAARRATELRRQLFSRRLIRDTAKENAREVIRQQNQRNIRPPSSFR